MERERKINFILKFISLISREKEREGERGERGERWSNVLMNKIQNKYEELG